MKNVVNTADLVIAWLPELSKGIQYVLMIFFLFTFGMLMYLFIKRDNNLRLVRKMQYENREEKVMSVKTKIFIDGSEGTTGLRIQERCEGRDDIELLHIDSELRNDVGQRKSLIN